MKLSSVKLLSSVLFDGNQQTFLEMDRHRVDLDFDNKTMLLTITSLKDSKELVLTPMINVVWMKPLPEKHEPATNTKKTS